MLVDDLDSDRSDEAINLGRVVRNGASAGFANSSIFFSKFGPQKLNDRFGFEAIDTQLSGHFGASRPASTRRCSGDVHRGFPDVRRARAQHPSS